MITALSILMAHNLTPHHHHDTIEITEHHHDDDGHDHSLFSFGQLDENFIPTEYQFSIDDSFSPLLFLLPHNILTPEINYSSNQKDFKIFREFPPPEKYFSSSSHRGPPLA